MCLLCFFFFFSSRRRHTRWTGDWSSDVCSSDLGGRRAFSSCEDSLMRSTGVKFESQQIEGATARLHHAPAFEQRKPREICLLFAVPQRALNALRHKRSTIVRLDPCSRLYLLVEK